MIRKIIRLIKRCCGKQTSIADDEELLGIYRQIEDGEISWEEGLERAKKREAEIRRGDDE